MAKKKESTEENYTVEETQKKNEEPKLFKRGQAVPVDPSTGAPALDALPAPASEAQESTASYLALQEGSPESKMPGHIGTHAFGARTPPPPQ